MNFTQNNQYLEDSLSRSIELVSKPIIQSTKNNTQNNNIYLYNNYLNQYNSLNDLNNDCYILNKQVIKPRVENKTVFKATTKVSDSRYFIHPKEISVMKYNDLLLIPFIICLLAFVAIFVRYTKYLSKFFEGLIYSYVVEKFVSDLNVPTRRLLFFLDSVALITLSYLVFSTLSVFGIQGSSNGVIVFSAILGGLIAYRIYYFIFHKFIAILTADKVFTQKLYFDSLLAIRGSGIFLFPLSFFIYYMNVNIATYLLYFALGVLSISLIYRIIRLLSLFIKNSISLLYFILYLCALEIVPIIILYIEVQRM